jgi:uncharacterized membrane protein YdfJ with MMPL/SSD domain
MAVALALGLIVAVAVVGIYTLVPPVLRAHKRRRAWRLRERHVKAQKQQIRNQLPRNTGAEAGTIERELAS